MKFYKVMAIPVLTHASETCTVTGKEKQHILTAEMDFLRYVSGYRPVSYTHLDVYKRQHITTLHI